MNGRNRALSVKEIVLFALLGSILFLSKVIMATLPNIHLVGMMIVTFTVVYRAKALFPIYVYVLAEGLFMGFGPWWVSYLYVWTILWGAVMLLPKSMPSKVASVVYMLLCAAHGFLFGILFIPGQALALGWDMDTALAWVVAGLPFDAIHGVSNFVCAILVIPFSKLLRRLGRDL